MHIVDELGCILGRLARVTIWLTPFQACLLGDALEKILANTEAALARFDYGGTESVHYESKDDGA